MMSSAINYFVLLLCVVMIQGCASAKLTIEVDIFDRGIDLGEPKYSENDLGSFNRNSAHLAREAARLSEKRKAIADKSVNTYRAGWLGALGSKEEITKIEEQNKAYQNKVDGKLKELNEAKKRLNDAIFSYLEVEKICSNDFHETFEGNTNNKNATIPCLGYEKNHGVCPRPSKELSEQVLEGSCDSEAKSKNSKKYHVAKGKLDRKLAEYLDRFNELVEGNSNFPLNWDSLENLLNARQAIIGNAPNAQKQLADIVSNVKRNIQEIVAQIAGLDKNANDKPANVNMGVAQSVFNPNMLSELKADIGMSQKGEDFLGKFVKTVSRYREQLDRLQNAGDPAWRIVSDPRYEKHWNKRFVKTYFRAEGKSAVIVVRDSPIRYRVFHGHNDPKNLIKGQLEISRSLGTAALSIVGAATGLPAAALASTAGTTPSTTTSKATTTSTKLDLQASNEAFVTTRRNAKASLLNNLLVIQQKLLIDPTLASEDLEVVKARTRAVLLGHKPFFTTISQ